MTETIFDSYWRHVKEVLGEPSKQKGGASKDTAIRLSEKPRPELDGKAIVGQLYEALACTGWGIDKAGSNWIWRTGDTKADQIDGDKYKEVKLERTIAQRGEGAWTWQMPTASGIQKDLDPKNNAQNKKASIDLVRKNGPGDFTFVELKVESNNPLYALFELLGYALAYLHARNEGNHSQANEDHDVLKAKRIRLVVLGPKSWYRYMIRTEQSDTKDFCFNWLAEKLATGLQSLDVKNKPQLSMCFEVYTDDLSVAAEEIIKNASNWGQ